MHLKKLKHTDRSIYDSYAKKYGSIFNSLEWLSIYGHAVEPYGFYDDGDNLIGGFFLYKKTKWGFPMYVNPAYTPSIGPFLKLDVLNPSNMSNKWKNAITLMAEHIDNLSYAIVSFSLSPHVVDTQPYLWNKFKVSAEYTYILDLSLPTDNLLKGMSYDRRNNIKKGEKDRLLVNRVDDLSIIKDLVDKTFSRQKMNFNSFYLDKILFEFSNNTNSYAFATFQNDRPIACSFCVYDNNTSYYLLSGYDSEYKHNGAGPLAVWEAIKYARQLGLNYFDFEGSMVPQIERYFRDFGGRLTPYFRINKAKLPLELLLKFYKRELF